MAYHSGDAELVTREQYENDFGAFDEGEHVGGDYDSREDTMQSSPFPYVKLPHSCGPWVVGTREQVRLMIDELVAILAKLETA